MVTLCRIAGYLGLCTALIGAFTVLLGHPTAGIVYSLVGIVIIIIAGLIARSAQRDDR